MRNMSSWSNLAQTVGTKAPPTNLPFGISNAGSTVGHAPSTVVKNAADSFEAFKQQAKERQRIDLLKQQEEQRQREVAGQEREKPREKLEETIPAIPQEDVKFSSNGGMKPGVQAQGDPAKIAMMREMQRRRRQAMAGQIDMNHQSDIMKNFEESLF